MAPLHTGLTRQEVQLGQIVHLPNLQGIPSSSVLRQHEDGKRQDISDHPCIIVGFNSGSNVVQVKTVGLHNP